MLQFGNLSIKWALITSDCVRQFSEEGKVVESRFAARTGLSNKWYNDDKALFVLGEPP